MTERVVADANVLLKLAFKEALTAPAERIAAKYRLTAPDIVIPEVANGLWKAVRFSVFDGRQAQAALAGFLPMLEIAPAGPLAARALEIATMLSHPVYDCLYAALAEREKLPFVTADKKLLAKLTHTLPELMLLDLHALPKDLP